jgi:transposase
VVLEPPAEMAAAPRGELKPKKARRGRPGGIELEIDGVVVRVERGAEARTVAAVIQALKRAR